MGKQYVIRIIFIVIILILTGCAKRIPIDYNQAQLNSIVSVKTISGKTQKGLLKAKKKSFVVLQLDREDQRSLVKINRDDIVDIRGKKSYVQDPEGKVISEWEIHEEQNNNNLMLYTLGGGGLSFGASFFIGSLLRRGIEDEGNIDEGENVMWGTTALGTVVGTYFFSRAGAKRDRIAAIDKIREIRYQLAKKKIEEERLKRKKVQEELKKLKAEREKQKEEINELMKKSKKEKK